MNGQIIFGVQDIQMADLGFIFLGIRNASDFNFLFARLVISAVTGMGTVPRFSGLRYEFITAKIAGAFQSDITAHCIQEFD